MLIHSGLLIRGGGAYSIRDKRGRLKARGQWRNGATTVGMNLALDVHLHGTSAVGTWYLGLIDNASYSALAAADTMSSHSGWIELVAYDEAARVTYVEAAASAGLTTNTASPAVFTFNDGKTVKGIFCNSVSTKSGTTGTLWATGLLDTSQAVVATDTLTLTYENQLQALTT